MISLRMVTWPILVFVLLTSVVRWWLSAGTTAGAASVVATYPMENLRFAPQRLTFPSLGVPAFGVCVSVSLRRVMGSTLCQNDSLCVCVCERFRAIVTQSRIT